MERQKRQRFAGGNDEKKTYKPKDGEIEGCVTSTCVSAVPGAKKLSPTLPLSLGLRELPLEDALRNEPWKVSAEYQERWQRKHPGQTLHLRMLLDTNTE